MREARRVGWSWRVVVMVGAVTLGGGMRAAQAEDPYLTYVRNAPEFRSVAQDPRVMIGRWDTWLYMPWRYKWGIGTADAGGEFCKANGINGGFTDHGGGPFDWLNKYGLRFYNDHTAGKGDLYLHNANDWNYYKPYQRDPRVIRGGKEPKPLDDAMRQRLTKLITERVGNIRKHGENCVAYALDDEVSWGAFVKPLPWRVNDDDAAYAAWLKRCYGDAGAPQPQYVTPDVTWKQLDRPLGKLDFSPLLDRLTYNDSVWANMLGDLVTAANKADPTTPCGFVGGQSPNIWGGYDYAKLMHKIQYIEAYDLGSSQAVIRSLNPGNALPQVTSHFHNDGRGTANDVWQAWYYFAHGNRGMIGWIEGWFDGQTPKPWIEQFAPALREIGGVQGPKLVGSTWVHDGVAIYYSHPSIQVSWCLDAEAHRSTWVNRANDFKLGTSHNVRKAWEHLLTDSGIQYSFIAYDRVITDGVPDEYRVLILPACYALSDIEAERITAFAERGGTVIADFACGLFDQHGKGRRGGALDTLFGVKHTGDETAKDLFGDRLWVETDQDRAYSYKKYRELFDTIKCTVRDGFAVAEPKLGDAVVRKVGKGRAVYMNLSPQRYMQYREENATTDAMRDVFVQPVRDGGATAWVTITGPDGKRPRNCEATYWSKGGRTYVFVVQSASVTGNALGGGAAVGLSDKTEKIEVRLAGAAKDVRNERTGEKLGDGDRFAVEFNPVEAVLFSFEGGPARGR
ncbi:MAG: beta-galactosidase [Phycisphaera sp.]|nr:beta-galactosidase [Phycisphaera sp.]